MTERMAQNNAKVERSAALASREAPVAVLQFVRMIRDTAHPDRKLFHDPSEVTAWLGEVLTSSEAERLRAFLAA